MKQEEILKDNEQNDEENKNNSVNNQELLRKNNLSDEIIKLNDLKNKGLLTEEEYKKAKEKLLD